MRRSSRFLLALVFLACGAASARRALAQAADAGKGDMAASALPDAGAWLGEPGRAGWTPMHALGLGPPLVHAGLARGGWSFVDPDRPPEGRPFPGLVTPLAPLSGYDSLTVEPGRALEEHGPERALAVVRPLTLPTPSGKPHAVFHLVQGDFGIDETALSAARGGDNGRVLVEAFSATRAAVGPFAEEGRHRWNATLGRRFGASDLSGSYRQAGLAQRMRSSEEQTARGGSGRFDWRYTQEAFRASLGAARQWDSHQSFGGSLDPPSRRDAQETSVGGHVERAFRGRWLGLRGDWNHGRVARVDTAATGANHDDVWATAWFSSPGTVQAWAAEIGAGRIGATGAVTAAPAVRWEQTIGQQRVELTAGRLLEPVWSDIAGGEPGFLQSTWTASAGARRATPTSVVHLRVIGGTTRDRAVISRLPLEEQWLRAGIRRDPNPWQFVEFWGETRWSRGAWLLGAEGTGLLKKGDPVQPRVDPDWTARAYAEWGFHAFKDDLGVRLRAAADGIGARNTDEAAPRVLEGYVTSSLAAMLTIGDATVTLRARNLENQVRPDVWIDSQTGAPALGLPRELRVAVTWTLNN